MQAAGDVVPALIAAELTARVQHRENGLQGGGTGCRVDVRRDASAVVLDGDAAVRLDGDGDEGRVSRLDLVHAVVEDLPDHVVQAFGAGVADVHARSLSDGFEALEDLDGGGSVGVGSPRGGRRGDLGGSLGGDDVAGVVAGRAAGLFVADRDGLARRDGG